MRRVFLKQATNVCYFFLAVLLRSGDCKAIEALQTQRSFRVVKWLNKPEARTRKT